MTVRVVGNDVKVEMYIDHKDGGSTLTEIGEEYGVSRKTVRRCITEVEEMITQLRNSIGEKLPYLCEDGSVTEVEIHDVEATVGDLKPVFGAKKDIPYRLWFSLDGFMSAKDAVSNSDGEISVGSRVQIREDSEFYGFGETNPENSVKGVVEAIHKSPRPSHVMDSYVVTWDNGCQNFYRKKDLELAVEETQEIDNAQYMVTAPQDSITIVRIDGETGEVTQRQANKHRQDFKDLREQLKEDLSQENLYKIYLQLDTNRMLSEFTVGRVKVAPEQGTVVFVKQDGTERSVPEELANDIIETVRKYGRENSEKLLKFLDNLMDNPSFKAIEGLYMFLKHNSIKITEDGLIEAWKGVRDDLYSAHAGRIKSSATIQVNAEGRVYNGNFGVEIRVDRSEVDDDPDKTCSHGLHVGSREYAEGFSPKLLKVLLNPKDVVAVPKDYDGQKLRCCAYTPIEVVN